MARIIGSPSRYIQGKGTLAEITKYTERLGKKLLILVSKSGKKRVEEKINKAVEGTDTTVVWEIFNGECSKSEVNRIGENLKKEKCDVVVGIGGGKILDTAKAVAYYEDIAVVCVPTAASTDAPCSALSVLYTDDGQFDEYLWLPANPDIILLDTDIIVAAPVRLIVSGMGDALATYFETRACMRSNTTSCMGGSVSKTAMALSELCFKTLMEDGAKALLAVNAGACTPAVENIIEANTYLSGIGFESGGIAAAHAIHNGLTCIEETHGMYHGEEEAKKADTAAKSLFAGGAKGGSVPTTEITKEELGEGLQIIEVLEKCKLIPSRGEGRRLVQQGGVRVNEEKVTDIGTVITAEMCDEDGIIMIQKGKKTFHQLKVK